MTALSGWSATEGTALLVAAALCIAACSGPKAGDPASSAARTVPTSQFSDVRLTSQAPDGTRWTLEAERGKGWEGEGTGELEGVRGILQRASGEVRLEAARAEVEEMDVIRLSGGVTLRWDGYSAEMARAEYRRREGRVTSDEAVKLDGDAISVRGTGLDLDVSARTARILVGATARVAGARP